MDSPSVTISWECSRRLGSLADMRHGTGSQSGLDEGPSAIQTGGSGKGPRQGVLGVGNRRKVDVLKRLKGMKKKARSKRGK